jgi:hypothetical protein
MQKMHQQYVPNLAHIVDDDECPDALTDLRSEAVSLVFEVRSLEATIDLIRSELCDLLEGRDEPELVDALGTLKAISGAACDLAFHIDGLIENIDAAIDA